MKQTVRVARRISILQTHIPKKAKAQSGTNELATHHGKERRLSWALTTNPPKEANGILSRALNSAALMSSQLTRLQNRSSVLVHAMGCGAVSTFSHWRQPYASDTSASPTMPGVRIAPASSTWASWKTLLEKSGAKGAKTRTISLAEVCTTVTSAGSSVTSVAYSS